MAPQERNNRLLPSWPSPVESKNLTMETNLSFGQKLRDAYQDYFEWEDMSIFLQLDTALEALTETTPGDRTMPGKLIAQENSINEKIKALQGDAKTPEAIRDILDTAILECKEEQARTKNLQINMEVKKVDISDKENIKKSISEEKESDMIKEQTVISKKEAGIAKEQASAREDATKDTAEIERILEKVGGIEKIIGSEYNTLLKETIAERDTENKKNGKDLSDEELRTEARTQIFLNNRTKIEKACPDEKDALTALFWGLEKSAKTLKIWYKTTSDKEVPSPEKVTKEAIKNDFSFSEGKTVIRKGNELIAQASDGSKEIWDLSERPPTKRIELNGVSIESKTRYKPNFEYLTLKSETESKISNLKGTIKKGEGHLEGLSKMASKLEMAIQKKDTPKESAIDPTVAQEYGIDISSNDDKEGKIKLTEVQKEIQETQTHIDRLQTELEKAEEFLAVIEEDESHRVTDYQAAMKKETESHRSNLQFLSSTHLDTILGQSGIDALINAIDKNEKKHGMSLHLDTEWGHKEKNAFAQGAQKLLGAEIFNGDGINVSIKKAIPGKVEAINATYIKGLLTNTGVYDGDKIPPVSIAAIKKRISETSEGSK